MGTTAGQDTAVNDIRILATAKNRTPVNILTPSPPSTIITSSAHVYSGVCVCVGARAGLLATQRRCETCLTRKWLGV